MAFIKIDKKNFFHNLSQFEQKIGSKKPIAIVLKDNAYGHGLELMAQLSKEFGLTKAVVRSFDEAITIKPYFNDILVLGDRARVDAYCSFALNSLEDIKNAQKGSTVELKVDTGMHRNGIAMEELKEALDIIKDRGLILKGVMSHNRSADELSSELFWQQKNFEEVKRQVKHHGFASVRFHSFNSASALRLCCRHEELIRLGIGAYGYSELPNLYETFDLKPVLSLWANKISTRVVTKGQRVGYGGSYIAPKEIRISTYDLGYGDGWIRSTSTAPFITAEGLPILGRVSMDYITLESSKEEVCIVSNAQISAMQLNTISYEVMTLLSREMVRIVV